MLKGILVVHDRLMLLLSREVLVQGFHGAGVDHLERMNAVDVYLTSGVCGV